MKNTAYKVHVEEVNQTEVDNVNIEQGAMLVTDESLFMGFNGEQVRVFPPQSDKMGLGWVRYDDTQYTSSSPYSFTADTSFVIPNNTGNVIDTHIHSDIQYYDNGKIYGEFDGDVYLLTIAFKASIENANGYLDLYIEGGNGTPYDRVRETITFPKGNNVEHTFAKTLQYYADDDVVLNGLTANIVSSDNGSIYDIIFFIQRTQKHQY